MTVVRRVVATVAAVIGLLLGPSNVLAAPITQSNETFPMFQIGFNVCSGDPVALTGAMHLVTLVTADSGGGFHVDSTYNIKNVKGVDLWSGAEYVSSGAYSTSYEAKPPFPSTWTIAGPSVLVSLGPAPNLVGKQLIHETIDPTGGVTSTVWTFEETCL